MVKEKRRQRAYKTTDKTYDKAMKRAKRENTSLAEMVESWVKEYSSESFFVGMDMMLSILSYSGKIEIRRNKNNVIISSINPKTGSSDWRDIFMLRIDK